MSLLSKKTLTKKLRQSKKFREAYVFEHIKRHIPFQVRTMREERKWSQAEAGQAIGKPQNVISRLESPAYGKLTLQTLLDVAAGFDVGLLIKFVPFSRLVKEYENLSPEALSAKSITDEEEAKKLEKWELGESVTATANTAVVADPLSAHSHDLRKLANTVKVWRSKIDESTISNATALDAIARDSILLDMFLEGKAQKVMPISTGQEFAGGYTGLKDAIFIVNEFDLPPKQSTVIDYTANKHSS